jgi:hypothetical protein
VSIPELIIYLREGSGATGVDEPDIIKDRLSGGAIKYELDVRAGPVPTEFIAHTVKV